MLKTYVTPTHRPHIKPYDGRAAAQGARGGRGTPRATTSAAGTCSAQCAQRLHALAAGGGPSPRRDGQGSRSRAATGLRGRADGHRARASVEGAGPRPRPLGLDG
eukprot:scaffold8704_cov62-Phaeocystis_antarctica.AAC.2